MLIILTIYLTFLADKHRPRAKTEFASKFLPWLWRFFNVPWMFCCWWIYAVASARLCNLRASTDYNLGRRQFKQNSLCTFLVVQIGMHGNDNNVMRKGKRIWSPMCHIIKRIRQIPLSTLDLILLFKTS